MSKSFYTPNKSNNLYKDRKPHLISNLKIFKENIIQENSRFLSKIKLKKGWFIIWYKFAYLKIC